MENEVKALGDQTMKIEMKGSMATLLSGGMVALGLILAGCGGSSSDKAGTKKDTSTPENTQALTGTAAVGNPIAGGTLTAKCADGSGFTNAVTTQANGTWSGTVANGALPCALQVTGGTPNVTLHSFATQVGNVNVTPLTDLALALQVNTLSGQSLADWFAAPNAGSADFNSVAGSLTAAADALRTAMTAANFSLPADWVTGSTAIFNAAFSADPANDPYDKLLENLATAISSDANLTDYSALISSLTSGGSLPAAPATSNAGNTSPAEVNVALVGTKNLVFKKGGSGEGCDSVCGFSEDQDVVVIIGADNSLTVDGKKLTNPFYRVFATAPHLPEIIWKDGDIEYALTDNESGEFSEINVGDGARPLGPFSLPTQLGQLREDLPVTPAATLIGPLAGTYNPVIVAKSATYKGNSPLPVGGEVEVVVSSNGVVTIDGYTFDPDEVSYEFRNQTLLQASSELYYGASIKESETVTFSLAILVDPIDKQPVAWRLTRTTKYGNGSYGSSQLDLEERPIPQVVTDFFTELQLLGPVPLTMIERPEGDNGYTSLELCEQEVLTIKGDGSADNPWAYDLNLPGVFTPSPAVGHLGWDIYRRSYSRYSEAGGVRQIALKNKGLDLVLTSDGEVEVISRAYGGTETARATTDIVKINPICFK